ncbi:BON domain-containing protein [Massilia cavernae]|uniref:Osmotically-inducible protein Y n=2 Tax=Massilia cavernae TaxID=2320864 RepID=A0A418XPZ7_9BURK|nr:BON domain-containing protein [Massilia cavernae]
MLAAAIGTSFAAQAAESPSDPAAYRNMTQKAAADYKAATSTCASMSGNARKVCVEEAKVARARAEADAVAQYKDTKKDRTKARTSLADADYSLAKTKCADMSGAEKDSCKSTARSVHTAALADAKADRNMAVASTSRASPVTGTDTRDPAKAAAVDKCAQVGGQPTTGCLITHEGKTIADRTDLATDRAAAATSTVAQRTESAAERAADRTERMADTAASKTERAGDVVASTTRNIAAKTKENVADAVITTKIKADLVREPDLSAMSIHVETENGVVMLSGFVDSKADADRAVRLAKEVKGVTSVKSSIKVK